MIFEIGEQLSRLPGHSGDDGRMRYEIIAQAIKPLETIWLEYRDAAGRTEWQPIDVIGIVASILSPEKRYITGVQDGSPRNLFFDGIFAIRHPQTGEELERGEGIAQLFSWID